MVSSGVCRDKKWKSAKEEKTKEKKKGKMRLREVNRKKPREPIVYAQRCKND